MDVAFYVEERHCHEGLDPFPWDRSPVGWKTLSAACQAMEHLIGMEKDRTSREGTGIRVEFRVAKVATVVVANDDNVCYTRAGGDCVCESCGKKYRDHPMAEEILGYMDQPWLSRLCDGSLVKL